MIERPYSTTLGAKLIFTKLKCFLFQFPWLNTKKLKKPTKKNQIYKKSGLSNQIKDYFFTSFSSPTLFSQIFSVHWTKLFRKCLYSSWSESGKIGKYMKKARNEWNEQNYNTINSSNDSTTWPVTSGKMGKPWLYCT